MGGSVTDAVTAALGMLSQMGYLWGMMLTFGIALVIVRVAFELVKAGFRR